MTAASRVAATRSNLIRCQRRLGQVQKGAALLKRKREALVRELLGRARTAVTSREGIDAEARKAWQACWEALAADGEAGLAALAWPERELEVELTPIELWGVRTAVLGRQPVVIRSLFDRGMLPGPGEAGAAAAAHDFERLLELLIEAAPQEHLMRRLGRALSRTTRLVNTLEQRVAVGLAADVAAIRRTLEEREREEHQRVRRLVARRRAPGGGG